MRTLEGLNLPISAVRQDVIAAAALPDEWEGNLDLWTYYLDTCVQFWVLVGLAGTASNVYNILRSGPPKIDDLASIGTTWAFVVVACVTRRWWINFVTTAAFLTLLVMLGGKWVENGLAGRASRARIIPACGPFFRDVDEILDACLRELAKS